MKKFFLLFIILGIIVGLIYGHKALSESDVEENNIEPVVTNEVVDYEINLPISDIDTLNPLRTKNSHIVDLLKLVYEPLFSYNEEGEIEPCLASEYAKRDDLTWIIKLKDNILWHGGERFSSNDVKYTLDLLINNEIDSVYIKNVKNIESVEIVDNKTAIIKLFQEEPYFISNLTFPILPEYYFKAEGILDEEKANHMVGTGPYMYESSNDSVIRLVANGNWHTHQEIKLSKINLRKYATYGEAIKGFKSSEVDMMFTNMHNWKEKFGFIGINSYNFESNTYDVIIPNTENALLNDSQIRKAILYAINRDDIIARVFDGNATISDIPITSNSKYYSTSLEYNFENARQLLLKSGFENTGNEWIKDKKKLSFNLIVPENNEEKIKCAEIIKQYLGELGINITIKKQKWNDYEKNLIDGKFDLAFASIEIQNEYQIQKLVHASGSNNFARYNNTEMNQVINELENSSDEVYFANMKSFIDLYNEELPYIGLFFEDDILLSNKSVKGQYESTSYNPYRNIINFSK